MKFNVIKTSLLWRVAFLFLIFSLFTSVSMARSITNYNEYGTDIRMDEAPQSGNTDPTFYREELVSVSYLDNPWFTFTFLSFDDDCVHDRLNYMKFTIQDGDKSYYIGKFTRTSRDNYGLNEEGNYIGLDEGKYGRLVFVDDKANIKQSELNNSSLYSDLDDDGDYRWTSVRYVPAYWMYGKEYKIKLEYEWQDNYGTENGTSNGSVIWTIKVGEPQIGTMSITRTAWDEITLNYSGVGITKGHTTAIELQTEYSVDSKIKTEIERQETSVSQGSVVDDLDDIVKSSGCELKSKAIVTIRQNPTPTMELSVKGSVEEKFDAYPPVSGVKVYYDRCSNQNHITWSYDASKCNGDHTVRIYYKKNNDVDYIPLSSVLLKSLETYHNLGSDFVSGDSITYYVLHSPVNSTDWIRNNEGSSKVKIPSVNNISAPTLTAEQKNVDGQESIVISWPKQDCENDKLILCKVAEDGTKIADINVTGKDTYIDKDIHACSVYRYYLESQISYPEAVTIKGAMTGNITVNKTFEVTSDLNVSKGIYSNKVRLKWSVDDSDPISVYKVKRAQGNEDYQEIASFSTEAKDVIYDDTGVLPGIYYKYIVEAEYKCSPNPNEPSVNSIQKIKYTDNTGFIQSAATITGRVAYINGSPVKDVSVLANINDEGDLTIGWRSLRFSEDKSSHARIEKFNSDVSTKNGITLQAWICPLFSEIHNHYTVFSIGDFNFNLYWRNKKEDPAILLSAHSTVSKTMPIKFNEYSHIALVLRKKSFDVYVNGKYIFTQEYQTDILPSKLSSLTIGNKDTDPSAATSFYGYIDEVRLWSSELTEKQIQGNMGRALAGNEANLAGYWRFDDGFNDRFYDMSYANADRYNENHGILVGVESSNVVPAKEKFWVRGITDENGNYIISGIPYEGTGTAYSVVPQKGTHVFNPGETFVYIGNNGATIHNNINFTDRSSFTVRGYVYYENTAAENDSELFPVQGVKFNVDGEEVIDAAGNTVMTDSDGYFECEVPMGQHYFTVSKEGHTFKNGGRYPTDSLATYNLQEDVNTPIKFFDTTRASLVGRVAGGSIQSELEVGFGAGKNNIGVANVLLKPQKIGYKLPALSEKVVKFGKDNKSTIEILNNSNGDYYSIKTDTISGEYLAYVIPEKYTISAYIEGISGEDYFTENDITIDVSASNNVKEKHTEKVLDSETKKEIEVSDSLTFNAKQNFIHYEEPLIIVKDKSSMKIDGIDELTYGEKYYVYKTTVTQEDGQYNASVEIPLVSFDNDLITYTFGSPIYFKNSPYQFEISAYEYYTNGTVRDSVPMSNATISIENNLAMDSLDVQGNVVSTNKIEADFNNGLFTYVFYGGYPNLNYDNVDPDESFKQGFSLSIKNNESGKIYSWPESGMPMEAFVLGGIPTGGNYVTAGPDQVVTILRDPPGAGSYATIKEGTKITNSVYSYMDVAHNADFHVDMSIGIYVDFVGGKGLKEESTVSYIYEVTEEISTSSSMRHVEDDVFVGLTSNFSLSELNTVDIFPVDDLKEGEDRINTTVSGTLKIGDKVGDSQSTQSTEEVQQDILFTIGTDKDISINNCFQTKFVYSESQVENEMINTWKEIIDTKLDVVESIDENFINNTDDIIYQTTFEKSESRYRNRNEDLKILDNGNAIGTYYSIFYPKNSAKNTDEILQAQNNILNWEKILSENEREKAECYEKGNSTINYSIDSGSSVTKTITTTSDSLKMSGWYIPIELVMGIKGGWDFEVWDFEIKAGTKVVYNEGEEETEEVEQTHEVMYHLQDENIGNYISVDVYEDAGFSPIFVTRGGQTSCPYEPQKYTKYYQPGTELNYGTQQMHKPGIEIINKENLNVPAGEPVVIDVKLMNKSESESVVSYTLLSSATQNIYGAKLTLDGSPLEKGLEIVMGPNSTVHRQILFEPVRDDSINYENVALLFASTCQYYGIDNKDIEIFETDSFTVQYLPSCSDIKIISPKEEKIVNTNTGDICEIIVGEFDTTYKGFNSIYMQYRRVGDESWTSLAAYAKDEESLNDISLEDKKIIERKEIKYSFDMTNLPDGKYEFRAITRCGKEADIVDNESNWISITKDTEKPKIIDFAPDNGILTSTDQLVILFNENIKQERITKATVEIQAEKYRSVTANPSGIYFDGVQSSASTEELLNLKGRGFTIEWWMQREGSRDETILTLADKQDAILEIGFTKENKLFIIQGDSNLVSELSVPPLVGVDNESSWEHIAITYDNMTKIWNAYLAVDSENHRLIENKEFPINVTDSYLKLGKYLDNVAFKGKMHGLRIWAGALTEAEISSNMSIDLPARTEGLLNSWPMTELYGNTAADVASYKHLTLNADWFVQESGFSAELDGTEKSVLKYNSSVYGMVPKDENFTLEFFFKTNPKVSTSGSEILFSSGMKDVKVSNGVNDKLSIELIRGEGMKLLSNTISYQITTNDFSDGVWHHFCMSVDRASNATFYIDGELATALVGDQLSGIENSYCYIGARVYQDEDYKTHVENIFTGAIDEFRIWNTYKTQKRIKSDMHKRLMGDESFLIVYYPFDAYKKDEAGQYSITEDANSGIKGGNNLPKIETINADAIKYVNDVPLLTTEHVYAPIASDIVTTDNSINPYYTVEDKEVNNRNIKVIIYGDNVQDLNGNSLGGNYEWNVYVDKNRLVWAQDTINMVSVLGAQVERQVNIINLGGSTTNYEIRNIPSSWLSIESEGVIEGSSTETISLKTKDGLSVGYYSQSISLYNKESELVDELLVSLQVENSSPDWEVDKNISKEYSMSLLAHVKLNGVTSNNVKDKLAAFIGGKCVGVTSPSENGLYSMNIYGKHNDIVEFKFFDYTSGVIYARLNPCDIIFNDAAPIGNVETPFVFKVTNLKEASVSLKKGWNWVSMPLKPEYKGNKLKEVFENQNIVQVKTDTYLSIRNKKNEWIFNADNVIESSKMYKLNSIKAESISIYGTDIEKDSISLSVSKDANYGWNWIGFPVSTTLPIDEAFVNAQPIKDEVVKGQDGFAMYYPGIGWVGTLTKLETGKGYLYLSKSDRKFVYPISVSKRAATVNNYSKTEHWSVDPYIYPSTMSVVGIVSGIDIEETDELAAFYEDKVCGVVRPQYIDGKGWLFPVYIYGEQAGVPVTFKYYDSSLNKEYQIKEKIEFSPDVLKGTPDNPFVMNIVMEDAAELNITAYPKPVKDILNISHVVNGIYVYDTAGQLVHKEEDFEGKVVNLENLNVGYYILKTYYQGTEVKIPLIKK